MLFRSESGERERRRLARAREEVSAIAVAEMRHQIGGLPGQSRLDELAGQVANGKLDPYSAADELIGLDQTESKRSGLG